MELLKLLSANEIVAQIINFFIVLWLLRKFLWRPILKVLDQRKEKIAADLKSIEEAKATVAGIKADYEARITSIHDEVNKKIRAAEEEGRRITEGMRKKAHTQAQAIIDEARANMKYELNNAKETLKQELIDIAIKAAELVIEERLDEKQDRRIVNDFLRDLKKV
ncbi:MAG: F0F1 ATP synthase subunit B [Candidatus Omnitrophota bacterium]